MTKPAFFNVDEKEQAVLSEYHHLINEKRLRLLKPTAFLVNTARGKVVDTDAVSIALRVIRLGGVALDTFEGEKICIEEEFLKRDDLPAIILKEAMVFRNNCQEETWFIR